MEFFTKSRAIKLRSHINKYIVANDDHEAVSCQAYAGSSAGARWLVEPVEGNNNIFRLISCYGKYLAASDTSFLLGITGKKVIQANTNNKSCLIEWEPVRDGFQVKLRTKNGRFLRANRGTAPWKNLVTHDSPIAGQTKGWVLWGVEAVEITENELFMWSFSLVSYDMSTKSPNLCSKQSINNEVSSSPKSEGKTIYYHVATDEYSDEDEVMGSYALTFNGNRVDELTQRLQEETGLKNIIVCTRSPLNRQLYPLRLQLPPNTTMHVIIVPASSKVASDFGKIRDPIAEG